MISFRPLESELAGWFGGEGARILPVGMRDPLTPIHEEIHAEVARYTTDGHLLGACMIIAAGKSLADPTVQSSCLRLRDALIATSRESHEAVATYLSLMRAPPQIRNTWFESLPPAYKTFYLQFSWLDESFPSQIIRGILAWNIALVVFCSPLLGRLSILGFSGVLPLLECEKANTRFADVMECLRKEGAPKVRSLLYEAFAEKSAALNLPVWDLTNDDQFLNLGISMLSISEFAATKFREWLVDAAPIAELRDPELSVAEDSFLRLLSNLGFIIGDGRPPVDQRNKTTFESEIFLDAQAASGSRVVNPNARPLPDSDPKFLDDETVFSAVEGYALVIARTDSRPRGWHLLSWTHLPNEQLFPPPESVARYSEAAFLNFLKKWKRREELGERVPRLLAAVAVVNDFKECFDLISDVPAAPQQMLERFAWYYMGNWCDVIRMLNIQSEPVLALNFGSINVTPGEIQTELSGIVTKVLTPSRSGKGIYIRCFNKAAAEKITVGCEYKPRRSGQLIGASEAETKRLTPIVAAAMHGIVPLLREF